MRQALLPLAAGTEPQTHASTSRRPCQSRRPPPFLHPRPLPFPASCTCALQSRSRPNDVCRYFVGRRNPVVRELVVLELCHAVVGLPVLRKRKRAGKTRRLQPRRGEVSSHKPSSFPALGAPKQTPSKALRPRRKCTRCREFVPSIAQAAAAVGTASKEMSIQRKTKRNNIFRSYASSAHGRRGRQRPLRQARRGENSH